MSRTSTAPLATANKKGKPILTRPAWPVMVQNAKGIPQPDSVFMVSVARREEKGSDVNVASHLLIDVMMREVDAAIVITNDSDLAFPIQESRRRVPIGLVNPTKNYPAGRMNAEPTVGVGRHWWYSLQQADLLAAQLPQSIQHITRPIGWKHIRVKQGYT